MLQNYFFLNRFLLELKTFIIDAKIEEIFSQEKSQLVVVLSKMNELFYLEMSVIPGNSYLNLRKTYSRAKKNTVDFFDNIIGQNLNSIEICNNDRIIKLNCTRANIYFTIRGKFTNIIYLDENDIPYFFKSGSEQDLINIKKELKKLNYLSGWNSLNIQTGTGDNSIENIRKKYPFLGNEIVKEVKARVNTNDSNIVINTIYEVLYEINVSKPCVFINETAQEVHLGFEKFKSFPFTEKKIFQTAVEAVNFYLSKRHYLAHKFSKLKLIKNLLERELKKVSNKINNLQAVIERGSKEDIYNKYGNLLLGNLVSIKSRMTSIVVEDIYSDGEEVKIELNPRLSPQKNVDYYFDKSRSEKISFEKNHQLLKKAKDDFVQFNKIDESLNEIESLKDLDVLMKKLKIKPSDESKAKEDLGNKFKQYLIENKYNVYVGKDSKNNDLLTTRFAKQNDFWFHARGASGSHVILRVVNTKEPIPKNILKKAAALAAYHSKAKTAGIVPVAFTFKKYVVKKKGDPVGTVHLLREDVLLVKPEIPKDCDFVTAE